MDPAGSPDLDALGGHLQQVQHLLSRHRLVAAMVNRQESPKRKLVDSLVQRENLGQIGKVLNALDDADVARILEALPADDRLLAWEQVKPERLDRVLLLLIDDVREELVNASGHQGDKASVAVFDLRDGRLRQVKVTARAELAGIKPIWVDLVAPSAEARHWVGEHFGIDLPDPATLTDLESSARFFVERTARSTSTRTSCSTWAVPRAAFPSPSSSSTTCCSRCEWRSCRRSASSGCARAPSRAT